MPESPPADVWPVHILGEKQENRADNASPDNALPRMLRRAVGDGDDAGRRVAGMASAAKISESTVRQILRGEIACPPRERLAGFANALSGVTVDGQIAAAKRDGCTRFDGAKEMDDATEAAKHLAGTDGPFPVTLMGSFGGAQDFGEYDRWKATVVREQEIDTLAAIFDGLLGNIRNDAELTMDAKAARIATVAGELGRRVATENSLNEEKASKALDDPATETFWFEAGDFTFTYSRDQEAAAEKAATRRVGVAALRASDFASVADAAEPSTWRLPLVRERSGGYDLARIEDAITALQTAEAPDADAISRVSAAIEKAAGESKRKDALRDRLVRVRDRADGGSFTAFKDLRGNWRWFAIHSNEYRDRDGERFAAKAHDEYVEWVDADPAVRMPELRVWHIPGSRLGRADMVDHTDGFMIATGPFDPDMEHAAKALTESDVELGCSHGFWFDADVFRDGVYHRYRSFEVSVLPRDRAANEATGFIAGKEVPEMDADKKAMLVSTVGQERADEVETKLATLSKEVGADNIVYKDIEAALLASTAAKDGGEGAGAAKPDATAPPAALEPIATALATVADTVKEIAATVERQGEQLEALKEADAEKIKNAWRPRFDPSTGHVASVSDGSETDPDSDEMKAAKAQAEGAVPEHLKGYRDPEGHLVGLGAQPVPAGGTPA